VSRLVALVERGGDDGSELQIHSPAVGLFGKAPRLGEVLVGGSRVGRLDRLGRGVDLVLPRGVGGRVVESRLRNRHHPVEHGQLLLRLLPVEKAALGEEAIEAPQGADQEVPEGTHAVTSPTHGMFYRRPGPDSPAYVEPGQQVETGATLALVEVMKCFTSIAYGGEGLPPRAEIVEVCAEDGAEIKADQLLFVVRPVQ
jgi:biotin carboxyl carrier protein